jgi:dolichol-phosphate mannosyltransferase
MALVSYVIPVYNNAGSIELTWQAISNLFRDRLTQHDYEVIFVNDGSRDQSLAEMRSVAARDAKVRSISFTRNFGQLSAILAGYAHAAGEAVINMSADLQDPVELTADMIQHWVDGSEVVIAHRSERDDSMAANLFSYIAYGLLRMSNPNMPRGGFDFTLMGRDALNLFLTLRGRNRFFQGDVLWAGFATTFIPYARRRREIGKSQYNFSKKLKLFWDFIIDGTYFPIRLMSLCGLGVAVLGGIYAAIIVVARMVASTPFPGWAPIMIVMLLVGGMNMLMLGVIGEYIWRILDEIKAKPMYVIDEHQRGQSRIVDENSRGDELDVRP